MKPKRWIQLSASVVVAFTAAGVGLYHEQQVKVFHYSANPGTVKTALGLKNQVVAVAVRDLKVGQSTWVTPWATWYDWRGRRWLDPDQVGFDWTGGTTSVKVTRVSPDRVIVTDTPYFPDVYEGGRYPGATERRFRAPKTPQIPIVADDD